MGVAGVLAVAAVLEVPKLAVGPEVVELAVLVTGISAAGPARTTASLSRRWRNFFTAGSVMGPRLGPRG